MKKVRVSTYPGTILRRPGIKRLRQTDTDEQINKGLSGGGVGSLSSTPYGGDYFTEKVEEVEFSPWVERMIRRGSLKLHGDAVTASPPRAAAVDAPVPMKDKS